MKEVLPRPAGESRAETFERDQRISAGCCPECGRKMRNHHALGYGCFNVYCGK